MANMTPQSIVAMERRAYAMWLRRRGNSYPKISVMVIAACSGNLLTPEYDGPKLSAEHLPKQYGPPEAYRDIRAILVSYAKRLEQDTVPLRAELEDQLQSLIGVTMEQADVGNLYAVQVALQAIQTKARLLGLNVPERKDVHVTGGIPVSLVQQVLNDIEQPDDGDDDNDDIGE